MPFNPTPNPCHTPPFCDLHPDLQRGIERLGFTTPTPIQISSVGPAAAGRDILACAETGSGKTAAFLLPIMHRLLTARDHDKAHNISFRATTRALILTPTRELAAQINEHLAELARFTTIRGAAIFGGVGMGPQEAAFRRGVDILIATPGRLLDHFTYSYGVLPDLQYLVLDEADRMLDMGFLPDIRRVMRHLPTTPRQTMLFSATLPEPIVTLSRDMLRNPCAINIERPPVVAHGIEHAAFPVPENLKQQLLLAILRQYEIKNAIVFTRTKHRANRLSQFLAKHQVPCDCIHGNRSQLQRTKALADFKAGSSKILVATDIAARGIDIEALSHVINFDVPHLAEDYIHRSGRTARASLTGLAFTLVSPAETADFRQIERHIKIRIKQTTLAEFDYQARSEEALEIPLAQRIAAIRAKKAEDRARAAAKARAKQERTGATGTPGPAPTPARHPSHPKTRPTPAANQPRPDTHHNRPTRTAPPPRPAQPPSRVLPAVRFVQTGDAPAAPRRHPDSRGPGRRSPR
jgi:ATP-dependent RNA helicase RhlE